jgi:hypothetical protein
MKYLFIDIRKSDEVYSKHFDNSDNYSFYNIPMNMIRFNVKTIINHLKYYDEIYIVCYSSNRSQFIKNKYFLDYDNIIVSKNLQFINLNHGMNIVSLNKNVNINVNIIGSNSFNFYNVMRIIQTLLGLIMLSIGFYIYTTLQKQNLLHKINSISLIILIIFGGVALFNGITSTCSISILFQNFLN